MEYMIRELRDAAGITQKAFAEMYGIPLSTLRKWEQGEASPAPMYCGCWQEHFHVRISPCNE